MNIEMYNRYDGLNKAVLNQIGTELLSDRIYVGNAFPVFSYHKNIWYDYPIKEYVDKVQSLNMVSYLLAYYKAGASEASVDKALQYFYLWYEETFMKNKSICFENPLIVSSRLESISALYCVVKNLDWCILDEAFEEVITTHCQFLTQTNAGQADCFISLYTASLIYENYTGINSREYREKAKTALTGVLAQLIDEDASYLGPSAQAACGLYYRLASFLHFLEDYADEAALVKMLKSKLTHLSGFIYACTYPTGLLPGHGRDKLTLELLNLFPHGLLEHYRYLLTAGLSGKPLVFGCAFFKKKNLFAYVNSDIIHPDFYKLLFSADFSRFQSKHNDDLSLSLYYKGLELLTEGAGPEVYAHNTIAIDRHDYAFAENTGSTGLTSFAMGTDAALVSGVSAAYENVLIRRNLLLCGSSVFIADEISSSAPHTVEIIFNLNPEIRLEETDVGFKCRQQGFTLKQIYAEPGMSPVWKERGQLCFEAKAKHVFSVIQIDFGSSSVPRVYFKNREMHLVTGGNDYGFIKEKYGCAYMENQTVLAVNRNINPRIVEAIGAFYQKL